MAGAPALVPQPAAFGAAAQAYGQQSEAQDGDEALMHNQSLTQRASGGEGGLSFSFSRNFSSETKSSPDTTP